MNRGCMNFGKTQIFKEDIENKNVLEVGACDVNGSLRPYLEGLNPASYLGVDISMGPGVDELCDINELIARYGRNRFDMVICVEMFEHVREWRQAVSNLKNVLKPNGKLLFTTRSKGFPYHGYPHDFWRYEVEDIKVIFSDLLIEKIEKDPNPDQPGVFLKARKPAIFEEIRLDSHELYSIIRQKRCLDLKDSELLLFKANMSLRGFASSMMTPRAKASFKNLHRRAAQGWCALRKVTDGKGVE